jgi:hypothetical protein
VEMKTRGNCEAVPMNVICRRGNEEASEQRLNYNNKETS